MNLIKKTHDVNVSHGIMRLLMSAIKPYRPMTKIMKFLYKLSDTECFNIHFNDLEYIYRSICDESFS